MNKQPEKERTATAGAAAHKGNWFSTTSHGTAVGADSQGEIIHRKRLGSIKEWMADADTVDAIGEKYRTGEHSKADVDHDRLRVWALRNKWDDHPHMNLMCTSIRAEVRMDRAIREGRAK